MAEGSDYVSPWQKGGVCIEGRLLAYFSFHRYRKGGAF